MARPRFPSDEARLKTPPHVKIPLTANTDKGTVAIWEDPRKRGMLVELWRLAGQGFAGRNGDQIAVSARTAQSLTGASRTPRAIQHLTSLCAELGYPWSRSGDVLFVTVLNFSEIQGYHSADRVMPPRTPSASDSDSDSSLPSEEKPKPKRAPRKPVASAAQPAPLKPSSRAAAIYAEEYKLAVGVNPAISPMGLPELGAQLEAIGEPRLRGALKVYFEFAETDDFIKKQGRSIREFLRLITKYDTHAVKRAKTAHLTKQPDVEVPEMTQAEAEAFLGGVGRIN